MANQYWYGGSPGGLQTPAQPLSQQYASGQQQNGGYLPWQSYRFKTPASSTQTNFNSLADQNPILAYKYLANATGGNDIQGLLGQYGHGSDTSNYITNAFMQPSMVGDSGGPNGGTYYDYLGLRPGDIPTGGEIKGNTFSAGGLSGTLAQQGAYEQKNNDPRAYLAANPFQNAASPGSDSWWKAVNGR
jgi:hypothetical protein